MPIIEDARADPPGPMHKVGAVLAWICGVPLILLGLTSLLSMQAGPIIIGMGLSAAGLLILPPVSALIGRHAPIYQIPLTPPLTAMGVFVALLTTGVVVGTAPKPPPVVKPAPVVAAKAPPKPLDPAEIERRRQAALAAYVVELNTQVTPQVEALTTAEPYDYKALDAELGVFDRAGEALNRGQGFAGDAGALRAMLKLQKVLLNRQVALLPGLRRRYARILHNRYWFWNGLEFEAEGNGNRILRASGSKFHSNAQIAWFHLKLEGRCLKLRFLQMVFNRGRTQLYSAETYNLGDPSDAAIGYWTRYPDEFHMVPALKEPVAAKPPVAKKKTKAPPRRKRSRAH